MRTQAGADDAGVRVARLAVAVDVVEDRDSGEGKVAAPERKLLERPASLARPGGQAQFDNQLVVREVGRERAGEKIRRGDGARAFCTGNDDLRVASHCHAGQLGCRIGMREAAAYRAAISHLVMSDVLDRSEE